ncbi:SDR family oxidoreductase [Budvicia diplopodorum]|uniref:SDR family oxidoreductase n=1 Tax=Budvicia diplopodorum TaxID=1119056 RepID=UPI00135ABFFD|nr:SDR family oxidoreductase [Budvicia diplopodorum]
MSSWLIFGAAQGTGALLLQRAVDSGQPVVAFVRQKQDVLRLEARGIRVVQGNACDEPSVEKACRAAGRDAVIISTIGGRHDYLAHRTVIDCAERCGIKRMVMVTSLGCGDSWPTLSDRAKAAFGQSVREKSLAESWLQTSALDYCILRPGGLLNGEPTGKAELYVGQEVHGFVNRSDIALVIERLVANKLGNSVYSLIEPGLKP